MQVNLEIFFDNDNAGSNTMNFMKYYLNKFRFIYNGTIRFHMNKNSKDFGVPLDEIDDYISFNLNLRRENVLCTAEFILLIR